MQAKKLRIAFNIDHFSPHRGGAERYIVNLVKYLLARGNIVHIFAMDGQDTIVDKHLYFHKISVISWFRWLKSLSFIINSSRQIKDIECDIVQVLGKNLTMDIFQPHGGVHRAWFRQNSLSVSSNKIIQTLYSILRVLDLKQLLFFCVESVQFSKKSLPHILAISQLVANDIKRIYGVPGNKITVIDNGIDTNKFSLRARAKFRVIMRNRLNIENKKAVLFVGNNFRLKGLRCFLETIQKLYDTYPEIYALILGSGNIKKFSRYAKHLGIDHICNFISHAETMEEYYVASDILILPTFYDPFGLVVLEALGCGVPVITTRFCGAGYILSEGKTGYIVDTPYDVDAIVMRAKYFLDLNDTEKVAVIANKSVQEYCNEKIFNKICSFYYSFLTNAIEAK